MCIWKWEKPRAGDEALGCYLVKQLDEFKGATIVRSRDPKVLDTCDIVLDVGGTYEPGENMLFPSFEANKRNYKESG